MRRLSADEAARLELIVVEATQARAGRPARAQDAAWDSHTLVELIFAAEDAFGFTLSSQEMERIVDRDSLEGLIAARLSTGVRG